MFTPIEGSNRKQRRQLNTHFASKIADHRNAILKDWAIKYEPNIIPKIPEDYQSPFEPHVCIFCLCKVKKNINSGIDEFRPTKDKGRMNIVNCNPCCGPCNGSKNDRCGTRLINWLKSGGRNNTITNDRIQKILEWYMKHEKYMIIPDDTINNYNGTTYIHEYENLDNKLNEMYINFQ